jgi:VanZ family protein
MIFGLSSIPGFDLPPPPSVLEYLRGFVQPDKFVHHILYAALAWLCLRALILDRPGRNLPAAALLAALAASAYGALDEWHQVLTPGRSCEFYDWLSDATGAAIAVALAAPVYAAFRRAGRLPLPAPAP